MTPEKNRYSIGLTAELNEKSTMTVHVAHLPSPEIDDYTLSILYTLSSFLQSINYRTRSYSNDDLSNDEDYRVEDARDDESEIIDISLDVFPIFVTLFCSISVTFISLQTASHRSHLC